MQISYLQTTPSQKIEKKRIGFSDKYLTDWLRVMVQASSPYNTLSDIDGQSLTLFFGANTKEEIENYIAKENLDITINYTFENLEDLQNSNFQYFKRCVGYSNNYSLLNSLSHVIGQDNVKYLSDKFGVQHYGIATKIDDAELLERLNLILDKLSKSGRLEEIQQKWGF